MSDYSGLIEKEISSSRVPALSAGFFDDKTLLWLDVKGERLRASRVPISLEDRFHIGSCAKTVTSLLFAQLVDKIVITWDTTLANILEVKSPVNDFTIAALLSHTAGLPRDLPQLDALIPVFKKYEADADPRDVRAGLARDSLLSNALRLGLPSEYHYSNIGYIFAGTALEHIYQEPFETITRHQLIEPLGLTSTAFGLPQAYSGYEAIEQPIGHSGMKDIDYKTQYSDNHPVLSPAGRMHFSTSDLATYLQIYLQAKSKIISREQMNTLLNGVKDGFPLGWNKRFDKETGVNIHWCTGTNTFFFAVLCCVPEKNKAAFVSCNDGSDNASNICRGVINSILADNSLPLL